MPLNFSDISKNLSSHFYRKRTGTNIDYVGENVVPSEENDSDAMENVQASDASDGAIMEASHPPLSVRNGGGGQNKKEIFLISFFRT